jgi:hypothetical protein
LLLLPFLFLGLLAAAFTRWLTWPLYRRWKQRPFDAVVWKNNPPSRGGAYTTTELAELDPSGEKHLPAAAGYDARDARYWMVDDAIRRIQGKSRDELSAILGEPDGPSPGRHLLVDSPDSWQMTYALSPEGLFGRSELLIRLDDQGRVRDAKVARSAT